MAQDCPPDPPPLTAHAIQRFQERIEALTPEAIQELYASAYKFRSKVRVNQPYSRILLRPYKGGQRLYLSCRSPNGTPAFFAFQPDWSNVSTVYDLNQWNMFKGTTPTPDVAEREKLIAKLQARDAGARNHS